MDSDVFKTLVKARQEAVQKFLDENADLFGVSGVELDDINEKRPDHDKYSDGPWFIGAWILITSEQSVRDEGVELTAALRSRGLVGSHFRGLLRDEL